MRNSTSATQIFLNDFYEKVFFASCDELKAKVSQELNNMIHNVISSGVEPGRTREELEIMLLRMLFFGYIQTIAVAVLRWAIAKVGWLSPNSLKLDVIATQAYQDIDDGEAQDKNLAQIILKNTLSVLFKEGTINGSLVLSLDDKKFSFERNNEGVLIVTRVS